MHFINFVYFIVLEKQWSLTFSVCDITIHYFHEILYHLFIYMYQVDTWKKYFGRSRKRFMGQNRKDENMNSYKKYLEKDRAEKMLQIRKKEGLHLLPTRQRTLYLSVLERKWKVEQYFWTGLQNRSSLRDHNSQNISFVLKSCTKKLFIFLIIS